jgi:L-alanine-DL-glutamate epimerase-like enolase superfamily enzyme
MHGSVARATAELWRYKLAKAVGGSGVASVDVIVVELTHSDGATGMGFSYVLGSTGEVPLLAARQMLERFVQAKPMRHPEALCRDIQKSLNRTGRGPSFVGLAAIDVAVWDLHAKLLGLPLGLAMGGTARAVPVYGSGIFNTSQSPEQARETAIAYMERGVAAVKPRVGGRTGEELMLKAVAEAIEGKAALMMDANEKCSLAQAKRLLSQAAELGALFVEEPLPALDIEGHKALAAASPVAIATGEHLQGLVEAVPFLAGRLCAVIQPDLAAIGGLTESLRVARVAEALGIAVAPHFLPNLFIHLAAAAPNVTWLEDFPLLEPLFGSPAPFGPDGNLSLPDTPGHGLAWAPDARKQYLVEG